MNFKGIIERIEKFLNLVVQLILDFLLIVVWASLSFGLQKVEEKFKQLGSDDPHVHLAAQICSYGILALIVVYIIVDLVNEFRNINKGP